MKKFQDTEQNYYWNFSKKFIIGTYENYKSKWGKCGKKMKKKKIANYKIQIVMEIIDTNRRNKKHTRYKYIRYQR